eukprot:NODE_641_length_5078_cov_0.784093.p5 type:complete len:146 gc:universal NODE_641_length_5078_cov_0.784093:936-1373(+)
MGRDLNMKKSWHPLSRQNLEKMLVESKKKKEENRKIKELEKEIKLERQQTEWDELKGKKKDRVDFLYAGQAVTDDNEDFLLGKSTTVQKILEKEQVPHKNELADLTKLQNKIKHDPLYQMKKSQMSKVRKLSKEEKKRLLEKLQK